jgi:hypothetical protein
MRRWVALLLLMLLPTLAGAVSLQYVRPGTAITFSDTTTSGTNYKMTTQNIGAAGRVSDRVDKGTGAQPAYWEWRCTFRLNAAGTVGTTIDFYVASSNGTHNDGELSSTDAALTTTDPLLNLRPAGSLVIDKTTANADITGSGQVYIPSRYFSWVYWNGTGVLLQNTISVSFCELTPMTPEAQ